MGWLFRYGSIRKELIDERTQAWEAAGPEGITVRTACLAHCYRGNRFSGILWSVWERTFVKNGVAAMKAERWIVCDLLRHQAGYGWGFKDMEESMHPFYYSCPLGYLKLVPAEDHGGCPEWRQGVREYHARQAEKRRCRARIAV